MFLLPNNFLHFPGQGSKSVFLFCPVIIIIFNKSKASAHGLFCIVAGFVNWPGSSVYAVPFVGIFSGGRRLYADFDGVCSKRACTGKRENKENDCRNVHEPAHNFFFLVQWCFC
jgi:hypothetical protein